MSGILGIGARLAAAAAFLAWGGTAAAQDLPPDAEARVGAILDAALETYELNAVLAGVSVGGAAPLLLARGELMTGVPATPDMHFRNGAVAIAYLGTLLLQLADQGVVRLDDPLSKWFPEHPKADAVTLTMLINGTSGYADYVTDDGFIAAFYADPFRNWTPEELIAIGLARPMACDPGDCFAYAHTNFVILGRVLEAATGRPLAELLREAVVDPLGLSGTRSDQTAAIPEPVLHAFDAERGRYEESTFWNPSWTLAEGSVMTSTIPDLLTSAAAVGRGTLLSAESHALQLAPLTAAFPPWSESLYYGFGVVLVDGWIIQTPSFAGFAATMAYLPAQDLAIAVSVTVRDGAEDRNLSSDVATDLAAALAPAHPLRRLR